MVKRSLLPVLVGLIAVLSACKSTDPSPADVTGTWHGTSAEGWSLTMTLAQSGRTVSGTGSFVGQGTYSMTAEGGVSGNELQISLATPGYFAITYSGTVNGNRIAGVVNESGFDNMPLDVSRPVRRGP